MKKRQYSTGLIFSSPKITLLNLKSQISISKSKSSNTKSKSQLNPKISRSNPESLCTVFWDLYFGAYLDPRRCGAGFEICDLVLFCGSCNLGFGTYLDPRCCEAGFVIWNFYNTQHEKYSHIICPIADIFPSGSSPNDPIGVYYPQHQDPAVVSFGQLTGIPLCW